MSGHRKAGTDEKVTFRQSGCLGETLQAFHPTGLAPCDRSTYILV
jgi:hypothetical protein